MNNQQFALLVREGARRNESPNEKNKSKQEKRPKPGNAPRTAKENPLIRKKSDRNEHSSSGYRDRAWERRQEEQEDEAPQTVRKGLDLELLRKQRQLQNERHNAPAETSKNQDDLAADERRPNEQEKAKETIDEALEAQLESAIMNRKQPRTRDQILADYKAARAHLRSKPTMEHSQDMAEKNNKNAKDRDMNANGGADNVQEDANANIYSANSSTKLEVIPKGQNHERTPSSDDIFADVGDDYNPFGGEESDSTEDGRSNGDEASRSKAPRNYFSDETAKASNDVDTNPKTVAELMSSHKELADARSESVTDVREEDGENERHRRLLQRLQQDENDLDLDESDEEAPEAKRRRRKR